MRISPPNFFGTAIALLLTLVLSDSARADLKYVGYYWSYSAGQGDFMGETAPFTNIMFIYPANVSLADGTALNAVRRARSLGSNIILGITLVNAQGVPVSWNDPNYLSLWKQFQTTYQVDQMVSEGDIYAFYLADEPYGNGLTRTDQEKGINAIHASYSGSRVMATYNNPLQLSSPPDRGVPSGLDIISFEHYCLPTFAQYQSSFIADFQWIKSKTNIPIFLTAESFGPWDGCTPDTTVTPNPSQQSWFVQTASDPQVIGVLYFTYPYQTTEGPTPCPPCYFGSAAYPAVIAYHQQVFHDLVAPQSTAQAVRWAKRVAALDGGTLLVKEGDLGAPWVQEAGNVQSYAVSGNRIAVLSGGNLLVKEGALDSGWVTEAGGVQSFALSGQRIAVLSGGTLYVKDGALNAPWVTEIGNVQSFALVANRIAILSGGTLLVKEGDLGAPWVQEAGGVQSFALSADRIAVLANNTLLVKEGPLDSGWVEEASGIQSYTLSGHRIAALSGSTLLVKEGALNASWVQEISGVQSFALSGSRIAVLVGGNLLVKQGSLAAGWVQVGSGVQSFALADSRIGVLSGNSLSVNESAATAPFVFLASGIQSFTLANAAAARP